MKIATWNISSGIDMNNYSGELFDKNPEVSTDDKCLNDIAKVIVDNNIDVIALQEVTTTDSFGFMEKLSELTGLKYFEKFENSPGFLIKDTSIGTAILSKYPISVDKKQFFTNPKLIKKTEKGVYSTHDKAYLAVNVKSPTPINIITTQFLPFHRFDSKIHDYKEYFNDFQKYILEKSSIVCGDFNVVTGKSDLVKLLDAVAKEYNFVFDCVTTNDNKRCDNILLPKNIKVKSSFMEQTITPSDHYMLVVEI